jgi:asparagine synthase (glutamine-hydrolysing)
VPLVDIEVFDYTKKMPIDYRCNKKATKYAFRIAAKRHLPEATANKKKLGFPVPIRVWLKEDKYYNLVKEAFSSETAGEFFDKAGIIKLLNDHKSGKVDNSRKIWTIYVFLVWHKVYFEEHQA